MNTRTRSLPFLVPALLAAAALACSEPATSSGPATDKDTGSTADTGVFVPSDSAATSDWAAGDPGDGESTVSDTGVAQDSSAALDANNVADAGSSSAKDAAGSDTGATTSDAGAGDSGANPGGDTASASEITQVGPVAGNGCADGTREGFVDDKEFPKIAACSGAWDVKGIHHGKPKCGRKAGNTGTNKAGKGCNVEDLCADGWRVCYGKADVLSRNPEGCSRIMEGVKEPGFFLARTSSTGAFKCSQDSTKFGDPGTVNDLFGCGNLGCGTPQGACTGNKKGCDPAADCAGCTQGQKCADKTSCTPSVCFPLNRASHDLCKTLKPMKNCSCTFTDPAKTKVKCAPSSGGCGWCKPVNYYEKLMGKKFPDAWDCGTSGSKEAVNVVKKDVALGGVLCCRL